MFTITEYMLSVDKYVNHARCVLSRTVVGGVVGDGIRIEDSDVGKISWLK